jgi:hypothetical protein
VDFQVSGKRTNRDLTYPHENILGRLPKTVQN